MSVKYPTKNVVFGVTSRRSGDDGQKTIKFSPPLSMQRYVTVAEVLADRCGCGRRVRVTEFGSGTFQFLYRCLQALDFVSVVDQVDIDETTIASALHLVSMAAYRPSRGTRTSSLTVNVFCGDATRVDSRTRPSDAVVAIELIEHLDAVQLRRFVATVFGFVRPTVAVFTTPNADFNVLFGDGDERCRTSFRHHDHKFEFTRAQFEGWTASIVARYNDYKVDVYGIGDPPPPLDADDRLSSNVGFCSQMAVFQKQVSPISASVADAPVTTPSPASPSYRESYRLLGSYQWR